MMSKEMLETSIVVLVDLSAAHRKPHLCYSKLRDQTIQLTRWVNFRIEAHWRINAFLGGLVQYHWKEISEILEYGKGHRLLRCSVYWRLLLHDNKAIIHPCAVRCARRKKLGLLQ